MCVGGSLLDELVRDGARQMLTAALQAEVDEAGHRLVVRNWLPPAVADHLASGRAVRTEETTSRIA